MSGGAGGNATVLVLPQVVVPKHSADSAGAARTARGAGPIGCVLAALGSGVALIGALAIVAAVLGGELPGLGGDEETEGSLPPVGGMFSDEEERLHSLTNPVSWSNRSLMVAVHTDDGVQPRSELRLYLSGTIDDLDGSAVGRQAHFRGRVAGSRRIVLSDEAGDSLNIEFEPFGYTEYPVRAVYAGRRFSGSAYFIDQP